MTEPLVGGKPRIGVVGCGLMGAGIAEVCARSELDVVVVEASDTAVAAGRDRIATSLARAAARGKITDSEAVLARIRFASELGELADRDVVVEAVAERADARIAVFRILDDVVSSPDAVLASNTSSIPIMRLAAVTRRPEKVIGIHFFNPVPVLPLVELVPSLLTGADTTERARHLVERLLGKHAILSQDRAGFIVNALLIPYLLSAVRMLESGFATAEDIDEGMVQGCAHPQGPLALCDLIGLDTVKAVAESLYEEFKEPLYAPPALLARMVEAGLNGRKSGRGFHVHS